jgi:hypothetical protein
MCEKHISEPGNARKCFARSSAHAGSTRSRPAPTSSPASARNRSIQCQPSRRCWRTAGLPSTLPLSQDCRKLGHGFVQSAGYVLASCFCERCPRTKKTDKPSSFVRGYRPAGSNISLFSREDKRPAALPILKSAVFDFPDASENFSNGAYPTFTASGDGGKTRDPETSRAAAIDGENGTQ